MHRDLTANGLVEETIHRLAEDLEKVTDSDVISLCSPLTHNVDGFVKSAVETRASRRNRLSMILETDGGFIDVVERIVNTLRHHYESVDFIVPDRAMSAGTVLAMAGDSIFMDYYSVLGPIDPQVRRPDNGMAVPALGYLVQFQRLMEKSEKGDLNTAEMAILLAFDQAMLYQYEQARELSVTLLKDWLVKYKFKNWTTTQARGAPVTPAMRTDRAEAIAKILNDTSRWHTHSRGIPLRALQTDVGLQIEDFGQRHPLAEKIREYHRLLTDYMAKMQYGGVVHRNGQFVPLV